MSNFIWIIISSFVLLVLTFIIACCKVSANISREELDGNENNIEEE